MAKKYDDFTVDSRALKFNVLRGNITHKDYIDYVNSLPDLASKADWVPAYEEPKEPTEDESLTFSVA